MADRSKYRFEVARKTADVGGSPARAMWTGVLPVQLGAAYHLTPVIQPGLTLQGEMTDHLLFRRKPLRRRNGAAGQPLTATVWHVRCASAGVPASGLPVPGAVGRAGRTERAHGARS